MKLTGLNIKSRTVYVDKIDSDAQGVYISRGGETRMYSNQFGQPENRGMATRNGDSYAIKTRKPSSKAIAELGSRTYRTFTNEETTRILVARSIVSTMIHA